MDILLGYEKENEYIIIFGAYNRYDCEIEYSRLDGWFLNFDEGCNDEIFDITNIDKEELYEVIFNRDYPGGDWPWCETEDEVIKLLEALIEESKLGTQYEEV